jgi:hypothetical protein
MAQPRVRDDPVKRSYVDSIDDDDELTAASLYLRAKHDADDPGLTPGARQEARHTMHAIVERFPGAARTAATAADHELGIENHAALKRVRDKHRAQNRVSADDAARVRRGGSGPGARAGGRQAARTGTQRPRTRTARPARRGRLLGGRTGRYAEQTGIPGAGRSAMAFTLQLLGTMIGLSLLYLILRGAEGNQAGFRFLEQGLGAVTATVRNVVSPVDPLAPRAGASGGRAPVDRTPGAPSQAPRRIAGQIPGLGSTPAARPARRPTTGQLIPGIGTTVPTQ